MYFTSLSDPSTLKNDFVMYISLTCLLHFIDDTLICFPCYPGVIHFNVSFLSILRDFETKKIQSDLRIVLGYRPLLANSSFCIFTCLKEEFYSLCFLRSDFLSKDPGMCSSLLLLLYLLIHLRGL